LNQSRQISTVSPDFAGFSFLQWQTTPAHVQCQMKYFRFLRLLLFKISVLQGLGGLIALPVCNFIVPEPLICFTKTIRQRILT